MPFGIKVLCMIRLLLHFHVDIPVFAVTNIEKTSSQHIFHSYIFLNI